MTSLELKKKFIEFFEKKGHMRIANASLIPENDPSALFINSGMHPIVPYLVGQPHPLGKRLVNYQRAVRTGDIEEVGVTKRHQTFFEMLGEWSLGDYWKKESLEWSFEFLTKELGLDPKRFYATVFKGNESVEADFEAIEIWKEIFTKAGIEPTVGDEFFITGESPRIVKLGEEDNFWPKGRTNGPCGPCSEIYYDTGKGEDADSRYLEVCNNVFMAYMQNEDGSYTDLPQRNIDVGWGYERLLCVLQGRDENGDIPEYYSNFETDLFVNERDWLLKHYNLTTEDYEKDPQVRKAIRIILDHIRASVMIIGDGVEPSNKDQGYILRRLIRRAVAFAWRFSTETGYLKELASIYADKLSQDEEYRFISTQKEGILNILNTEIDKFEKVLQNGIKELEKIQDKIISGEIAFRLKESLGLPLEITQQIAENSGKEVDIEKYELLMNEHQEKSRAGGEKKFVGGLGDYSDESIRYHTCAHLFLAGAKKILGDEVNQKGQNITSERLRYDVNYSTPIPQEKLQEIENWVNEKIDQDLQVDFIETTLEDAESYGIHGMFGDKYEKLDSVKIYRIYPKDSGVNETKLVPEDKEKYISLEFCGGPHVKFTSEIAQQGHFRITKEESSSQGVRRIKAILEK